MEQALTRPQKAAAILVAIGKPAAGKLLKFFKQEELKALIEGARMLRSIPRNELERIVAEFEEEFAEGAGLMDSADTMDHIINDALSPDEVNAILNPATAGLGDSSAPLWPTIEKLEPAKLAAFLSGEHPQTAAMIVSNLDPQAAAPVLLLVDKPARVEIVKRMVALGTVTPAAKRFLEDRLRLRLLNAKTQKSSTAGQSKVVSLLNELDKAQLDELMGDLAQLGGLDVEAIRSKLFSFEDISILSQKARVSLFDGLSSEIVTVALRKAPKDLAEAILSALGARSRRMIESELQSEAANVKESDIQKARRTIAATAIRLAGEGVLELPSTQAQAA